MFVTKINQVKVILKNHEGGLFLDDILYRLKISINNANRMYVVSLLKKEIDIERIYIYGENGTLKSVFKFRRDFNF